MTRPATKVASERARRVATHMKAAVIREFGDGEVGIDSAIQMG